MKLTKRQLKQLVETVLKESSDNDDSGNDGSDVKTITKTGDDNDREKTTLSAQDIRDLKDHARRYGDDSLLQDLENLSDFLEDNPNTPLSTKRTSRRNFITGLVGLTVAFVASGIIKFTGAKSGADYQGEAVKLDNSSSRARYCRNLLENIKKYQPQWLEPGNPIRYFIDASEFEASGGGTAYPYAFDANTQTFYYMSDADFQSFLFDAYGPEKISQLLDAEIQQAKNQIIREEEKLKTRPEYADTWRKNIAQFKEELAELQAPGYIPELDFWAINNLNLYFNTAMPENLYFYDYEYGIQRYAGTIGTMRYAPGRDHAYDGGVEIDQGGKKVFIKLDPPSDDYP